MASTQGDAALAPARTYSSRSAPQNAPYGSSQHPSYSAMRSNTFDPTYQPQPQYQQSHQQAQYLSSPIVGPRRQRNNTADGTNVSSIPEGSQANENDFWETPQYQNADGECNANSFTLHLNY